jgi:polypeptide N-acetylgalactosaminyltransferase
LIEEVILVNDCSTLDYLYKPLETYVKESFPKLNIKILNLKERHGIAKARVAGAKEATGKILFMMESHIELAYNWLPPLLGKAGFMAISKVIKLTT